MRFCVPYSDSHKIFLNDIFLKTFPFELNVSLVLERLPQVCSSGNLFSDGWRSQMIKKQEFINRCLNTFFNNEVLVFSDVDVSFYGNISSDLLSCLGDNDISFLKDHNSDYAGRCGGFFILKSNSKIRKLFSTVLNALKSYDSEMSTTFESSEQKTINSVLNSMKEIKWSYLPSRYYTHGLYVQGIKSFSEENQSGLWWEHKDKEEKENIFIPNDIKVHHANWAVGVKNKVDLLKFVYKKVKGENI